VMASIAPSRWSVAGESKLYSVTAQIFRFYHVLSLPMIAFYGK
jgi:hypothetical protein